MKRRHHIRRLNTAQKKTLGFVIGFFGCALIPAGLVVFGLGALEDGKIGIAVALLAGAVIELGLALYAIWKFHLELPDLPP